MNWGIYITFPQMRFVEFKEIFLLRSSRHQVCGLLFLWQFEISTFSYHLHSCVRAALVDTWGCQLSPWGWSLQELPPSSTTSLTLALLCRKTPWRSLGGSWYTAMSSGPPSTPWSSAPCWAQAFSSSVWSSLSSVSVPSGARHGAWLPLPGASRREGWASLPAEREPSSWRQVGMSVSLGQTSRLSQQQPQPQPRIGDSPHSHLQSPPCPLRQWGHTSLLWAWPPFVVRGCDLPKVSTRIRIEIKYFFLFNKNPTNI